MAPPIKLLPNFSGDSIFGFVRRNKGASKKDVVVEVPPTPSTAGSSPIFEEKPKKKQKNKESRKEKKLREKAEKEAAAAAQAQAQAQAAAQAQAHVQRSTSNVVRDGHDYLNQAEQLLAQYGGSLGSDIGFWQHRIAELRASNPFKGKLSKKRKISPEFVQECRIVLEDIQKALNLPPSTLPHPGYPAHPRSRSPSPLPVMIRIRPPDAHGASPKVSFIDAELTPPPSTTAPAPAPVLGAQGAELKRGSSKRGSTSRKEYYEYKGQAGGEVKRSGTRKEGVSGTAGVALYDPPREPTAEGGSRSRRHDSGDKDKLYESSSSRRREDKYRYEDERDYYSRRRDRNRSYDDDEYYREKYRDRDRDRDRDRERRHERHYSDSRVYRDDRDRDRDRYRDRDRDRDRERDRGHPDPRPRKHTDPEGDETHDAENGGPSSSSSRKRRGKERERDRDLHPVNEEDHEHTPQRIVVDNTPLAEIHPTGGAGGGAGHGGVPVQPTVIKFPQEEGRYERDRYRERDRDRERERERDRERYYRDREREKERERERRYRDRDRDRDREREREREVGEQSGETKEKEKEKEKDRERREKDKYRDRDYDRDRYRERDRDRDRDRRRDYPDDPYYYDSRSRRHDERHRRKHTEENAYDESAPAPTAGGVTGGVTGGVGVGGGGGGGGQESHPYGMTMMEDAPASRFLEAFSPAGGMASSLPRPPESVLRG